MLVRSGVADPRAPRHLAQRELPALVLAKHVFRCLDDDAPQILTEIDKIAAAYPEVSYRVVNYNPPSWCPPDTEMAQLVRANAKEIAGIDPTPVISLGGTDARLWRYKDIPAIVYGPAPIGMGSVNEHVTVEEFFHVVKCHVLSAYDYMSGPG